MLKTASYRCREHRFDAPQYNTVVYAILGDCCIYSGIERRRRTSTEDAAEEIVAAIAEQEGVSVGNLHFFDLQTRAGYPELQHTFRFLALEIAVLSDEALAKQRADIMEFLMMEMDKGHLILGQLYCLSRICVEGSRSLPCPPQVVELFRPFIGEGVEEWKVDTPIM